MASLRGHPEEPLLARDPISRLLGDKSAVPLATGELRREIRLLRSVLVHLLAAQVRGEPPRLDHPLVLQLLSLPEDTSPETARDRILRADARVLGTVACPSCGGMVQDLEGIVDERCPWCGEALATER